MRKYKKEENMFEKNNLPLDISKYITENLLRGKTSFTYNIKMFWFGRFDKLRYEDRINLDWISKNILSKDLNYKGAKANVLLLSDVADYEKEADILFKTLKDIMK